MQDIQAKTCPTGGQTCKSDAQERHLGVLSIQTVTEARGEDRMPREKEVAQCEERVSKAGVPRTFKSRVEEEPI